MNGKLKDWSFSRTGESVLTITTRESCKKLWDALGDQEITFSIKRRVVPRSLNANNYAWSLIEKLAVAVKSDKDSVYEEMLRRYGTGETYTDEAGNECKVLFSLREGVPPALVARHYAETGVGYVEGKKFIHYRAIKGTSEYSTKEMSVFLDGIISECQEVGIETDTPRADRQIQGGMASVRKVYCDYCGRETEYVDSKVIYGKSYGKIYLCRNCMAYVGVHKGTDKPLGRLANAELRNWKKAAHAVFDPLWKYGRFRGHRNAAYAWLAQKMGLPVEKTHIGMFDVGQCRKAIEIIEKETKGDRYGRYQKDPR